MGGGLKSRTQTNATQDKGRKMHGKFAYVDLFFKKRYRGEGAAENKGKKE